MLAPHIEHARRHRRHISELLALADADLVAALAGERRGAIERALEAFDPEMARDGAVRAGLHACCRHDAGYPRRLAQAADAPALLYVAGDPDRLSVLCDEDVPAVAVVGARRAGPDGIEVARGLGRGLAAAGVTVVSGMALGIDSAAHAGALEVGGPTLARARQRRRRAVPAQQARLVPRDRAHAGAWSPRCRRDSSRFAGAFRRATARSRAWRC